MASSEALTRAPKRARSQRSSKVNRIPSPQRKRHEPSIYYGEPISTTPCDDNESSQQELCEQCNLIDLDYVFTLPSKFRNKSGVPIVKLNNTTESIRCPLCCLFAAVKYPRWQSCRETHGYHLRALDSFSAMGIASCKKNLAAEPFTLLAAFPGKLSKRPERWAATRSGYKGFIASASSCLVSGNERCLLVKPSVDYEMLSRALEVCGGRHGRSCQIERTSISPSLVLDCVNRVVVPRRMNDYLALSYVWGHIKQSPLPLVAGESNTNSSSDIFPRTIEDAMKVVRRLGYRYLWVDRYCINQNNAAEKHTQIRDMGRIYANAVATIVAVSGNDSEAGLPGVSIVPRTEQPSAMIKGRLLVSTLPHLTYFLDCSAWASREAQAYFVCKSMTCSESLRDSLSFGSSKRTEPIYSLGPAILSFAVYRDYDNVHSGVKQTVFTAHLNEYTQRSLTYDADAISALRRIMGNLAIDDYWGIPIVAESGNHRKLSFLAGLFWSPKEESSAMPVRGRLQFPSWTWANLTVQVGYDLILHHRELRHMLLEDPITGHEKPFDLGTEVEIRLPSGIHLPVQDVSLSTAFSEIEAPSSLFIEIKVLEIRSILMESWNKLRLCVIIQNSYDESDCGWGEIFLDEIVGGIRVPADVRCSLDTQRWWAVGLFGCRYTPISAEESAKSTSWWLNRVEES